MEFPHLRLPLQPHVHRNPLIPMDRQSESDRYELFEIMKERIETQRLKNALKRKADDELLSLTYMDEEKEIPMEMES
jgi:hypothetical protein